MANSGSLYIFILFYSVIQFTLVTEYKKKCPLAHYCNIHSTIHYKIVTITYCALKLQQPITSHRYLSTTFHLGPYVPPVKDCSTHPVLESLSAPGVSNVLLHLFGITYLTTFDLLELLEPFVPDWRFIYFPSLHHRHAIPLLIHWFTVKLAINITLHH